MREDEILRLYTRITFEKIKEIANYLSDIEFPEMKEIPYTGPTESKVKNPSFWLEYDRDEGEPMLLSNLVPDNPQRLYRKDLLNYSFLVNVRDSVMKAAKEHEKRHEALLWIKNGKKCVSRYGWKYRGACCREITKEKALELFPKYSFGIGFYTLDWITENGEKVLEFNELSENDML